MTVIELIGRLYSMPADAIAVDSDELEIIEVIPSTDKAIVRLWSEQK